MLESIWFILWGVLWAVYFMLDGFDLGLGTLLPVLARNNTERRIIYNSMGSFWDGNEVWLISAGGVMFAAFPTAYAVLFSSLYTAFMLLLFALILRGVAFEFRGKVDSPTWRAVWDGCMVVGSFLPALLLGVTFANIFRGIPINAEGVFQGNLLTLLNPYGLLGGLLFLALFLMHGTLWLAIKSSGDLQKRAATMAARLWVPLLVIAVAFLVYTWFATTLFNHYVHNSTPLLGALLCLIPLAAVGGLVATRIQIGGQRWWCAWASSCVTIVATTLFGVVGLYPNLLPSSLNPAFNVTLHNAASSPLTLKIMLAVALTFVPIVIAYQAWGYRLFKDKVTEEDLNDDAAY